MELNDELMEAVKKSLPEMQCKAIVDTIKERDALKEKLGIVLESLDRVTLSEESLRKKIITLNSEKADLSDKLINIEKREKAVDKAESEVFMANTHKDSAREMAEFAKSMALGLVRNTEFRKNKVFSENGSSPTEYFENGVLKSDGDYSKHTSSSDTEVAE